MNYLRKYDTDCNKYYVDVQHFFRVQVFRFRILFKGVQFIVQSVQFIFQGVKCIYTLYAFLNKVQCRLQQVQIATSILWIYSTFAECSDFFLILD